MSRLQQRHRHDIHTYVSMKQKHILIQMFYTVQHDRYVQEHGMF